MIKIQGVRTGILLLVALVRIFTLAQPVFAQDRSQNVQLGQDLIKDNDCNGACHRKAVSGADPMTLYTRPIRKVNSVDELKRQVKLCISFLNAPIFPEDIDSIVTVLDHDAYHFD